VKYLFSIFFTGILFPFSIFANDSIWWVYWWWSDKINVDNFWWDWVFSSSVATWENNKKIFDSRNLKIWSVYHWAGKTSIKKPEEKSIVKSSGWWYRWYHEVENLESVVLKKTDIVESKEVLDFKENSYGKTVLEDDLVLNENLIEKKSLKITESIEKSELITDNFSNDKIDKIEPVKKDIVKKQVLKKNWAKVKLEKSKINNKFEKKFIEYEDFSEENFHGSAEKNSKFFLLTFFKLVFLFFLLLILFSKFIFSYIYKNKANFKFKKV